MSLLSLVSIFVLLSVQFKGQDKVFVWTSCKWDMMSPYITAKVMEKKLIIVLLTPSLFMYSPFPAMSRANPKSAIFNLPLSVTRIFLAARSRWMT